MDPVFNAAFNAHLLDGFIYLGLTAWALVGVQNGYDRAPWWLVFVGPVFFLVVVGALLGPALGIKLYVFLVLTFGMGYGMGRHLAPDIQPLTKDNKRIDR